MKVVWVILDMACDTLPPLLFFALVITEVSRVHFR
jgi:hypothetical protein